MIIHRTTLSPAMGKGGEVRMLIEANTKRAQGQGVDVSLSAPLSGDIPAFVVTRRFNDLAAFGQWRAKNAADKDVQEDQNKMRSMASIYVELLEVIIPFAKP